MANINLEDFQSKYGVKGASTSMSTQTDRMLIDEEEDEEVSQPRTLNLDQFKDKYGPNNIQGKDVSVDMGTKLRKDDLKAGTNLAKIRQYMVSRKGVQYNEKDGDSVVEDFVDHMRRFNTNLVSTSGEVRHITQADEATKVLAKDAYELYDKLGNVFVNDGFFGAVDGIKDYIFAAATDPTNYVGALTGGISKGVSLGVGQGAKQLVKRAAIEAGRNAMKNGATAQAAEQVGKKAAEGVARRLVEKGVKGPAAKALRVRIAEREKQNFLRLARGRGRKEYLDGLSKDAIKKSLYATTAIDATLSMVNDYQIQSVMLDVGAQEEYSLFQTGFSSLLGAVGGGAQLVGGKFKGASGLGDTKAQLKEAGMKADIESDIQSAMLIALPEKEISRVTTHLNKTIDEWEKKVKRGNSLFETSTLPAELLYDIMLGPDGKGGVAKVFKDNGMKLNKSLRITDVMTNVLRQMPQDDIQSIAKRMQPLAGYTLGDTTEIAQSLGDFIAAKVSNGMKLGNVMSQTRKSIDVGLAHGTKTMDNMVRNPATKEALEKESEKVKRMKLGGYTQSVWRRLLVSSPATSAINVMGFGQFYVGSTIADLTSMTAAYTAGLAMGGTLTKAGRESLRIGGAYKSMQAQKMRNLMDPYTTHDAYMSFLDQHKDVKKVLFESVTGGVERSGGRFGIDPNAKWFQNVENATTAMNRLTGVRIQDTFTKSQMFMSEMDKYLRLKKGRTLQEVLRDGDLDKIDDSVIGNALDNTMKSVYSKDYTTDDQLLSAAAKQIENFSNIPVLGTILPFGRFFNNTIATAYQWSVGGGVEAMSAIFKSEKRNIETVEAEARSLVGMSSIGLAMHYDEEKQKKGLAYNEIDAGGGTIVDAKNTFPFSVFLAAGRIGNLSKQGETVPKELLQEMGTQLAVGQFARDAQFGNDINNVLDVLVNQEDGARKASMLALYKMTGNFTAGFTRPLDAVNKLTGFITDTDAAKDVRQAKGGAVFTQSATKYFDNILEAFTDKAESVTGEELRVATREGSVQDANPLSRIFGVTIKPTRTATEMAYSMSEMQPWTASERSNLPEYDRIFNTNIAPVLEVQMQHLLNSKMFKSAGLSEKRIMLTKTLSKVKTDVRTSLSKYGTGDEVILSIRRKAMGSGSKNHRDIALKAMKEKLNFSGSIQDMSYSELQYFMDYVDYLKDIYK